MKVLVLGGGHCQLNMIKRLRGEGHYIILVDYLEDNPGKEYADEHHRISTFDAPAVLELVKISGAEAILTMGTDQPVLTASIAAKESGLPFYIAPETAIAVTNKRVMKEVFSKNGIPTVGYRLISRDFMEEDIAGISFPAVLKPVDSQGQRGIFKVCDFSEIKRHIDETLSYSNEHRALLEDFYPNDEVTVNGWVHDGKAHILSVVDRVTMEIDNRIGICLCHNYPSLHMNKYGGEIVRLTQKIANTMGIAEGPLYFQYLIGEDGLLVNEVAMRIGGAYEDITIPIISGIDILGMVMEYALKGEADTIRLLNYNIALNDTFISTQLFFINPGTISYITPKEELENMDCVRGVRYIIVKGDIMEPIKNATARAGYIIIEGADFDDTITNINRVFNKMQVLDENKNNLIVKYSDYKEKYKFLK